MTTEQAKRIKSAIADCDRYIAKEERRSADLRPAEVQKRLEWHKEHKAKLESMLASGKFVSKYTVPESWNQ